MCSPSPGPKDANIYMELVRSDALDVVPITETQCSAGILRHLDALVMPDNACDTNRLATLFQPIPSERRYRFLQRGGKVVTWGAAAKKFRDSQPGVIKLASGDQAVETLVNLRDAASAPQDPPATDPAKVAIYAGPGTSGSSYWNVARLIASSPLLAATFIDAEDIRNGKLEGFDLLVMGGGLSSTQYKTLGEQGQTAVRAFVRNGGAYYGICAGAFLALESSLPDHPRIGGLVPFREQPEKAYRGWAETEIRFTDEAFEKLGILGGTIRDVLYWGGPVILPGSPVPDSDIRVLAEYRGNMVNTFSGKPIDPMSGHAAIIGGTSGKGKLILSAPHPESSEGTQDIVRAILRYLTGRRAEPDYPERTKGAVSVGICVESSSKRSMTLGMELDRDPRFDLQPITWYEVGHGALEHTDVLLFPYPVTRGYTAAVQAFLKRGGRVVEFDPEKKSTTKPQPGQDISFARTREEVEKMRIVR